MEPALSCSPERVGRGSSAAVEPMLRSIRFARDSSMDRLHAIELAAVCADPCISQRSAIRHGLLLLESIAVSYQRRRRVGVVHGQEWHPSAGLHPHQDLELQRCSADEYSRRRTVGSSGASADADRSIPSLTHTWAVGSSRLGARRYEIHRFCYPTHDRSKCQCFSRESTTLETPFSVADAVPCVHPVRELICTINQTVVPGSFAHSVRITLGGGRSTSSRSVHRLCACY